MPIKIRKNDPRYGTNRCPKCETLSAIRNTTNRDRKVVAQKCAKCDWKWESEEYKQLMQKKKEKKT